MNKIINFSIIGLLIAGSVSAQGMMGNYATNATFQSSNTVIDSALQNIYQTQNIASQDKLDCSKVTDTQFEKLGDAIMGYGISEQQHTAMENMMGGEGSATLKQAHITMGRSYIGCWSNYNSSPVWMPMMGYVTNNSYSRWGMMSGYGYYSWTHWITMVLFWILLGLGIVVLVKWLIRKK